MSIRSSVVIVPVTGTVAARARKGSYNGFSLRATTAAVVNIWDNASAASGTRLDVLNIGLNVSDREYYPDEGIRVENGIYVEVVSGVVVGSIRMSD